MRWGVWQLSGHSLCVALCSDVTDLDVWVHIHKSLLAVLAIDAKG